MTSEANASDEWRALAQDYRESAAQWRKLIEKEEEPGGRGSSPHWLETRAILVEMAEGYERDAADAEARAEGQR